MAASILQKLNVFMAIQLLLHPIYCFKHYSMGVRKQLSLGMAAPVRDFSFDSLSLPPSHICWIKGTD